MVHFVGAGPGAPDLITRRGAALLQEADCIIYAGSLVNPALLGLAKPECAVYNSAEMTLEQVLDVMRRVEAAGGTTVRLHTGDPCLYGAIREQMDALDADGIPYDDTPGVSSFCGAAAALNAEYTLPTISQTVIITRMEGRTPVPEKEKLASLAAHGATMVIFLSIGLIDKVQQALLAGGAYTPETPAAVVYKASWPEQKVVRCTVGTLTLTDRREKIDNTGAEVSGGTVATECELLVGEERCEMLERYAVAHLGWLSTVDHLDVGDREVLLALVRRTHTALYHVAGLQTIALDDIIGHIHIVG